ncbi:hypothetical protein [Streptomyces sp. NPDC058701]|uniref:hypothetical protein n=1 Tax=Streptomyces sp. NPDC058701 TaxID=3346608 RepID=UPI003668A196
MRNIARVVATAVLATAAVLAADGVAAADGGGGSIDWPVAPASVSAAPQAGPAAVPAAGRIDWP